MVELRTIGTEENMVSKATFKEIENYLWNCRHAYTEDGEEFGIDEEINGQLLDATVELYKDTETIEIYEIFRLELNSKESYERTEEIKDDSVKEEFLKELHKQALLLVA